MPFVDLNEATELLAQWGWLLVTKANGIIYLSLVLIFVLGITVRLPGGRTRRVDKNS